VQWPPVGVKVTDRCESGPRGSLQGYVKFWLAMVAHDCYPGYLGDGNRRISV
jgi:hypothetical protein